MRSHFINAAALLPNSPDSSMIAAKPRIKYRDMLWAFHSDSQDVLLEASIKACPGKLDWANAKALGLFIWMKSPEILVSL